ncbi:MAG: hypothetical protein OXF20_09295 [Gammaproteobacteria bacterium]|nr:hypothetical protein [Gammaproteobacteria bacterium]
MTIKGIDAAMLALIQLSDRIIDVASFPQIVQYWMQIVDSRHDSDLSGLNIT